MTSTSPKPCKFTLAATAAGQVLHETDTKAFYRQLCAEQLHEVITMPYDPLPTRGGGESPAAGGGQASDVDKALFCEDNTTTSSTASNTPLPLKKSALTSSSSAAGQGNVAASGSVGGRPPTASRSATERAENFGSLRSPRLSSGHPQSSRPGTATSSAPGGGSALCGASVPMVPLVHTTIPPVGASPRTAAQGNGRTPIVYHTHAFEDGTGDRCRPSLSSPSSRPPSAALATAVTAQSPSAMSAAISASPGRLLSRHREALATHVRATIRALEDLSVVAEKQLVQQRRERDQHIIKGLKDIPFGDVVGPENHKLLSQLSDLIEATGY